MKNPNEHAEPSKTRLEPISLDLLERVSGGVVTDADANNPEAGQFGPGSVEDNPEDPGNYDHGGVSIAPSEDNPEAGEFGPGSPDDGDDSDGGEDGGADGGA